MVYRTSKRKKRVAAGVLSLVILVASGAPALAQTTSKGSEVRSETELAAEGAPLLTYEMALDQALKYTPSLRGADLDLERARLTRDQAAENAKDLSVQAEVTGTLESLAYQAALTRTQTDIQSHIQRRQVVLARDRVAYQVKEAYNGVLMAQLQLELAKAEEKLQAMHHQINLHKHGQGTMGRLELESSARQLAQSQKRVTENQQKAEQAYHQLNLLIGNSIEARPLLGAPEFTARWRESLTYYQNRARDTSLQLEAAERQIDLAKLDRLITDYDNPLMPVNRQIKDLEVERAEISVREQQRQLDLAVQSLYSRVEDLELQREQLLLKLEEAEEQSNKVNLFYEVGLTTEFEWYQTQFAVEQLKTQLELITLQHDQLRLALNNPFAAM